MMISLHLIRKRFAYHFTESDKVTVDSDLRNSSRVLAISCFSCCVFLLKLPNIPGYVSDKSHHVPFVSLLYSFIFIPIVRSLFHVFSKPARSPLASQL